MVSSQTEFYKIYTNNGYDFGQGIVQLEDSSYVITGSSSSFVEGASEAFLLKIDSLGNYIWSHHYGGEESDQGRRVFYKKNVGFYIAGYTNSFGNGDFDNYLVKTDENGTKLWEKSYGGSGWEKVNDAIMLADTGIMMVGQTNSGTAGNDNIYIVRTNKDGDTLWTKSIGGEGNDFATSIRALNDSISIIGGQTFIADSMMNKGYLLCIKNNGEIQWEHYFGNWGEYKINDLCIVDDHINVVGNRLNPETSEYDSYTAHIYLNGGLSYEFAFVKSGYDSYELVSTYSQTDKLYMAISEELLGVTYPIGKDLTIARMKENLLWDNNAFGILNSGDDVGGQIIATNDGGAIVVGYNTDFGSGGNNVFVAKIGVNDAYPITSGVPVSNNLVKVIEIEKDENNEISIFPNPTSTNLTIHLPENFDGEVVIKDILGKELINERITGNLHSLSVETLSKGNYFVSITSNNKIVENKMIVVY